MLKNHQNSIKIALFVLLFFISLAVVAQSADDIIGQWKSPDYNTTIEIYKKTNSYSAKIVKTKNQNEIGVIIARGWTYDKKEKEWKDGKIQKPDMHHSVSSFVKLQDSNTLLITGYHGFRFVGTTEKWKKQE